MTRVEISESADVLSRAAADRFVRVTTASVRARGRCAVALAGGSTPRSVYQLLADEPCRSQVPWDRIEFFWGDERHVPPDHADSNYRMAVDALLSKVPVDPRNIHRVRAEIADASRAAQEYEDEIRASFGGGTTMPQFDLVLLGLGTDGHTASLFPGTPALSERHRWCVANWVSTLNAHRITLTLPVINAAREVVFIVSGPDKAPIVREVLSPSASPRDLPARLVAPADGDLLWMLDRAAARELGETS